MFCPVYVLSGFRSSLQPGKWTNKLSSQIPLGSHVFHLNNFEFPTPNYHPMDDSCQLWLKSDYAFSRRWWKDYMQSCQPLEAQISTQHLKNSYFPFKIRIFFNRPSFQIILFWDLIYVLTQRICIGKAGLHTNFFFLVAQSDH